MREMRTEEIQYLEQLMEEMANTPREELGKRQPGEKCMYEIQRKEEIRGFNP